MTITRIFSYIAAGKISEYSLFINFTEGTKTNVYQYIMMEATNDHLDELNHCNLKTKKMQFSFLESFDKVKAVSCLSAMIIF